MQSIGTGDNFYAFLLNPRIVMPESKKNNLVLNSYPSPAAKSFRFFDVFAKVFLPLFVFSTVNMYALGSVFLVNIRYLDFLQYSNFNIKFFASHNVPLSNIF